MGFLTKEQILEADDLKTETVPVPEWGGEVIVRTMTGTEYDEFERSIISSDSDDKTDMENIRAKLCARTIIDEKGERLFLESEIVELGKKSSLALKRVFIVAQELNGMAPGDAEKMAKNSETTPESGSGLS